MSPSGLCRGIRHKLHQRKKVSFGKDLASAKKWLTDNGYTPVDADLNEKADSAFVSARAVCLGYKTTKNPDEAITDMKVMNMKGNYSFQAYEMILQEQAQQIGIFVSQLVASLKEYRENYAKGLYKAIATHDMLDKIYDDDTGKTMGELLLNDTVQELGDDAYSTLSDEEKAGGRSDSLSAECLRAYLSAKSTDSFLMQWTATPTISPLQ